MVMNKHKIIVRILIICNIVFAAFVMLLNTARIHNLQFSGDILSEEERQFIARSVTWVDNQDWISKYLIIIAITALISSILLIVKKTWGRVSSIVLGSLLLSIGLILMYSNFDVFTQGYGSFFFKLWDLYFGARIGYIDLICIGYGIITIVYFSSKGLIDFFTLSLNQKNK
jgi:hypothetical protein